MGCHTFPMTQIPLRTEKDPWLPILLIRIYAYQIRKLRALGPAA